MVTILTTLDGCYLKSASRGIPVLLRKGSPIQAVINRSMSTPFDDLLDSIPFTHILRRHRGHIQMINIIMTLLQQNLILLLCLMKPLQIPLVDVWLNRGMQKVSELLLILLGIIEVI